MKKLLPFFTFACLTAFSVSSSLPVAAGGCSSNRSKSNEIKCGKDDTECKAKNTEKFDLNEAINS
tara:strand:+ start:1092 stop:1286 length:195 start_codon:yes stop_codon:yes gene_type:complete